MARLGYVRLHRAIYGLIRYTITIIIIYEVPTKKWKDGLLYLLENFLPSLIQRLNNPRLKFIGSTSVFGVFKFFLPSHLCH